MTTAPPPLTRDNVDNATAEQLAAAIHAGATTATEPARRAAAHIVCNYGAGPARGALIDAIRTVLTVEPDGTALINWYALRDDFDFDRMGHLNNAAFAILHYATGLGTGRPATFPNVATLDAHNRAVILDAVAIAAGQPLPSDNARILAEISALADALGYNNVGRVATGIAVGIRQILDGTLGVPADIVTVLGARNDALTAAIPWRTSDPDNAEWPEPKPRAATAGLDTIIVLAVRNRGNLGGSVMQITNEARASHLGPDVATHHVTNTLVRLCANGTLTYNMPMGLYFIPEAAPVANHIGASGAGVD